MCIQLQHKFGCLFLDDVGLHYEINYINRNESRQPIIRINHALHFNFINSNSILSKSLIDLPFF